MYLTGAPGSALLYCVLALALRSGHERPARWLRPAWAALWVGGAALQVLAGLGAVARAVSANAGAAPGFLRTVDMAALSVFRRGPGLAFAVLVGIHVLVAVAPFVTGRAWMIGAALAVATPFVFWLFGQSLGAVWTGVATDPNSGPTFVLLAVAVFCAPSAAGVSQPERRGRLGWTPRRLVRRQLR
jgi:hypothetical protein